MGPKLRVTHFGGNGAHAACALFVEDAHFLNRVAIRLEDQGAYVWSLKIGEIADRITAVARERDQ
jgi:hypothetical protein